MNYFESLAQIARANPQRQPGSPGAAALIQTFKDLSNGITTSYTTSTLPVFQFNNSLWAWCGLGLVAILSGYAFPLLSMVGSILLLFLLINELSQPLLGKFATVQAQNLTVNLPAKNKETQKIYLIANYDPTALLPTPASFQPGIYLTLLSAIAAAMVLISSGYFLTRIAGFNHLLLLLLSSIALLNGLSRNYETPATLKNCAVLLETAAILNKVKPSLTSVTLCFCGARSLNSGVLALVPEFDKGPKNLTYVVNLSETADPGVEQIQLYASEGFYPIKNADPTLLSSLKEVAQEKALMLETVQSKELTETYYLNRAKVNLITIGLPTGETVSIREIRELLCGLIRKLDH